MQPLLLESFDMFERYTQVSELRRRMSREPILILDVGDPFATVAELFPRDQTVSLDVFAEAPPNVGRHRQVIGSGYELPFPDGQFDLVTSQDTLEHLDASRRTDFVDELLRVGNGPVLLAAPFSDPRTVRCEALVNAYFTARLGKPIPALEEHVSFGLPDLEQLTTWLDQRGVEYHPYADGWLYSWLGFWYLKAHLAAEGRTGDLYRLHGLLNEQPPSTGQPAPHYRRAILLRPGGLTLPLPPAEPAREVDQDLKELTALALGLGQVLVSGDDPLSSDSLSARWLVGQSERDGPTGQVARRLTETVEALRRRGTEAESPDEALALPKEDLPTVAVIIVNLSGADHLPTCLDSMKAQDYPEDLVQVLVVDNGSTDDSRELLARDYPWVQVLPQETNIGFAPAVDLAARAVDAECLALLNNDMRADPSWITELVRAYEPGHGVPCVGGQILSWDGSTVDFVQSALNFAGMGFQPGFGRPRGSVGVEDGQDLLFACGGAMLVERATYLNSGGFDPDYFAYFEDVDFGWRLWTLGFKVKMASRALSYHRHHGTTSRFPEHQRLLLLERNALRSMIKNYGDDYLHRTLGPSLMLLVERAVDRGRLDRDPYDIGVEAAEEEIVPRVVLSHLHAVADVVAGLPQLFAQREHIQRARQRSDDDIVERFGHPFNPAISTVPYLEAQEKVVTGFGLDQRFTQKRARRVLVVTVGQPPTALPGSNDRLWQLAGALSEVADVTVASPASSIERRENADVVVEEYGDAARLRALASRADVVLVDGLALEHAPSLLGAAALLVADLSDPSLIESMQLDTRPLGDEGRGFGQDALSQVLDSFDFFICASAAQRSYWLGQLSARGRVDSAVHELDPSLRLLIDVVPGALLHPLPRGRSNVLKGAQVGIDEEDLVVLCEHRPGEWLDPMTVLEGFAAAAPHLPNAKLYFLKMWAPGHGGPGVETLERVEKRASELGVAGKSVFFGEPLAEDGRRAYLLEADVAVTARSPAAQAHLGSVAAVIDHLQVGLPVVVTEGDPSAELVRRERLGLVVAPGDVAGVTSALLRLMGAPGARTECSARARALVERGHWEHTTQPLRFLVAAPWRWQALRGSRRRGRPMTDDVRLLLEQSDLEARALEHEVLSLRGQISALQQANEHHEARLALLRKTPAYPLFQAAKRATQWARKSPVSRNHDGQ